MWSNQRSKRRKTISLRSVPVILIWTYALVALLDLFVGRVSLVIEHPLILRAGSIIFLVSQIAVIPSSFVLSYYMAMKGAKKSAILGLGFACLLSSLFIRINTAQFWSIVLLLNAMSFVMVSVFIPSAFSGRSGPRSGCGNRVSLIFFLILALTLDLAYLRETIVSLLRMSVQISAFYSSFLSQLLIFLVPVNGVLFFLHQVSYSNIKGKSWIYSVLGSTGIAIGTVLLLASDPTATSALANHVLSRTSLQLSGTLLLVSAGALVLFLTGLVLALVQPKVGPICGILGIILLFSSIWRYDSPYFYGPAGIGMLLLSNKLSSFRRLI